MGSETLIEYENETWRCVYAEALTGLSQRATQDVLWNVVDMYKRGERKQRSFQDEEGEARIKEQGRKGIGCFFGVYYSGTVENSHGKQNFGIILLDNLDPTLN